MTRCIHYFETNSKSKKNYYNIYIQLVERYGYSKLININEIEHFLNLSVAPDDETFTVSLKGDHLIEIYNQGELIFEIIF